MYLWKSNREMSSFNKHTQTMPDKTRIGLVNAITGLLYVVYLILHLFIK